MHDVAAVGSQQPGDHPQQRRLPAPALPDQRDRLAGRHLEVDSRAAPASCSRCVRPPRTRNAFAESVGPRSGRACRRAASRRGRPTVLRAGAATLSAVARSPARMQATDAGVAAGGSELGQLGVARVGRQRAARRERAPGGCVARVGRLARAASPVGRSRSVAQTQARPSSPMVYGCAGSPSTSPRAELGDPAAVEHGDPVGDLGRDTEVVRDEEERRARSSRSRRSSSRICACTVTSSAVVGSSAMTSSGSPATAIAIITRWRSPPESSCGYAAGAAGSGTPTEVEQAHRLVARSRRLRHLPADAHRRVQRGHRVLEHRAEVVPAQQPAFRGAPPRRRPTSAGP